MMLLRKHVTIEAVLDGKQKASAQFVVEGNSLIEIGEKAAKMYKESIADGIKITKMDLLIGSDNLIGGDIDA